MRIWLEKEKWIMTKTKAHNQFQDNYFYIQKFNRNMQPINSGSLLGIPTPVQWTVGDGPIEPRLYQVNNTAYVTFNTGINYSVYLENINIPCRNYFLSFLFADLNLGEVTRTIICL
mgnify:FL=1